MPLDHIGRYKIEAELGKGAMGVVYKATDPNIGRTVALKTMRVDVHGIENEEMSKRFHAEARNAGVLNHANIVTIYDAQELEGIFYIAMEFIQGQTLQELLKLGTIPVEKVIDITRQACAGLDYAAARGIIHRDIKPANIMIVPDGTVKIMDFGIAKSAGTGMTSTGQVLGTPNYMSPEQVKGKTLDGRSDLFSMGVVLYEMLTGERPFTGENVTTIIYKIVNEQPPAPRDLDITVHPGLSAAVMKALAKNRDERYQKGADLAKDLENYKSFGGDTGQTTKILTDPAAIASPLHAATQVPAPHAVAAGGGAAAKPAPSMQSTVQVGKPTPKLSHPLPAKKSPMGLIVGGVLVAVLAVGGYVGFKMKSQPAAQTPAAPTQSSTAAAEKSAATPEPKKAAEVPAAETPSAAAATTGELRITSTPAGAKFTVDRRAEARFVTPFTLPKVKEGSHVVVFTMDGYRQETLQVDVVAGKRASLNAPLVATSGFILVTTTPAGATISVDGKPTGEVTPSKVKVDPGQHRITVQKPGTKEQTISTTVAAGQSLTMDFPPSGPVSAAAQPAPTTPATPAKQPATSQNVPPSNVPAGSDQSEQKGEANNPFRKGLRRIFGGKDDRGTVILRTRPEGAELTVDGRKTEHKTPLQFPAPTGKYRVTLTLPGYKPVTREVKIDKGKTTAIDEVLEKQ